MLVPVPVPVPVPIVARKLLLLRLWHMPFIGCSLATDARRTNASTLLCAPPSAATPPSRRIPVRGEARLVAPEARAVAAIPESTRRDSQNRNMMRLKTRLMNC